MIWQVAAILSVIFGTIRVFLDKKLIDRIGPFALLFYTALWSGIFFVLFFFLRHESFPSLYPEMISVGLLYVIAVVGYLMAIRISLSQTMVFVPYSFVIPIILAAIFLGEWKLFNPSTSSGAKTIIGMIFAIVSLYLIVVSDSKRKQKMESRWIYAMVIYITFIGIGNYLSKAFLLNHGVLEALISQQIGVVPIVFLFNICRKVKFSFSLKNHLLMLVDGLAASFAVTFFFFSIRQGPMSLVLPIQTLLLTISTTLVGLYVFKEVHTFTKEKLIGMGLGIVGIVLLVV